MAAGLQLELKSLQLALDDGDAERAREIIGNVGHICLNDVSHQDIDYCCSLIFGVELGLVAFVKKTLGKDPFQDCKSDGLEILLSFLKKFSKKILPYAVDIKDVCMSLFSRERLSKVKNVSLMLLIEILLESSGSKVCDELEVNKMIDKFMTELATSSSKHTPTVRGNLYHLLGVCAERFPENMRRHSSRLFDILVGVLKAEMTSKTKKPEMSVIAGVFNGLSCTMVNFRQTAEEGGKSAYEIYKFVRMALDRNISHSRYEMPRSALQLFARHAQQWDRFIIDDYEKLFDCLSYWSRHHNRDVLHDGTLAFDAFLKQVCLMLVDRSSQKLPEDAAIFKFLIQHFRETMSSAASTTKEISMAIRGYGVLAAPCRMFLSESDVRFMYNEMTLRSEQIYFGTDGKSVDDQLINLPSFLEAFASIVTQLEQVSDTFFMSLERLVVLTIETYPRQHPKLQYVCCIALLRVYIAVSHQGAAFRDFLSRTVYQGVIRSCSHQLPVESSDDVSVVADSTDVIGKRQKITYRDYISLWRNLLQLNTVKELQHLSNASEREILSTCIYDELITAVLKILSRLDLNVNKSSDSLPDSTVGLDENSGEKSVADVEHAPSSDPVSETQASRPKDMVVFVNLVDFCRDLLMKGSKPESFRPWIFKFGREVILLSVKHPVVSGLYKLFTICLHICARLHYFQVLSTFESSGPKYMCTVAKDTSPEEENVGTLTEDVGTLREDVLADDEVKMECDDENVSISKLRTPQIEASFSLFSKFAKEVSVQSKQYRDDLLASCLMLILALPDEIIVHNMQIVVPALQKALIVGRSYLPLANTALDTLEHWYHALPTNVVHPHYADILPLLDIYLKSSPNLGLDGSGADRSSASTDKVAKLTGKRRIPTKLLKPKTTKYATETAEETVQLGQVKGRCVHIIGMLGGAVNHVLVSRADSSHLARLAVAWDSHQHLRFDVPFHDLKPTIYFDSFLPRVVELATMSSNRRTKIAACELLHALVIFMIGREAQIHGLRDVKYSMDPLYRRVFPVVIQLVCDVELVARQLFKPLLSQLIHWFTSSQMHHSPVTVVLLDTIMDGLVSSTDAALRDLSGVCLREFVHWSIKQTSKEQLEKSPLNIKAVLRRLYSYARHPSAFKRLGASLGFNNIYMILREESSLVDVFIFDILVTYVESLSLAHSDDKVLGTSDQCKLVLSHLERIMRVKSDLLNKSSKQRKVPKDWNDTTLTSAIQWLLAQCGRAETECRHACMQLVYNLCPCLPGKKSVAGYFEELLKQFDAKYIIERFERSGYRTSDKSVSRNIYTNRPTMSSSSEKFSLRSAMRWFEALLAALDCYTWLFGQDLLTPDQLLNVSGESVLLKSVGYFMEYVSHFNIDSVIDARSSLTVFTPRDRQEFNQLKCTVVVRSFSFLSILLNRHHKKLDQVVPDDFWNSPQLWSTVADSILSPTSIGFDLTDIEIITKLPEEIHFLLTNVRKSSKACSAFQRTLSQKITVSSVNDLPHRLPVSLNQTSVEFSDLQQLTTAYKQLHVAGFLPSDVGSRDSQSGLARKLLNVVFLSLVDEKENVKKVSFLSIDALDLAKQLLQLSFAIDAQVEEVVKLLLDRSKVMLEGGSTSHGELFFATFKPLITGHLVSVCSKAIACLTVNDDVIKERASVISNVVFGILDVVGQDTQLRHKCGIAVIDAVLSRFDLLVFGWHDNKSTVDTKMMLLVLLTKLVVVNDCFITNTKHAMFSSVVSAYCKMLVDKKTNLAFKTRVLDLVMFFVSVPEPFCKQIRSSLDSLMGDNFPMSSYEFPIGSPRYNDYIGALDKILVALELSQSTMLFELLIGILCREQRHVYEDQIQKAFTCYVARLGLDRQKPVLDVAYHIYESNDGGLTVDQRRSVLERVCLVMLQSAHTAALTEFFEDHVVEIMTHIEISRTGKMMEVDVVKMLCSLKLVELMYQRLPKDAVHSKQSQINKKYVGGKQPPSGAELSGKEMTTALTKTTGALRSEDISRLAIASGLSDSRLAELGRLIHCAAYNALVAVISSTQTELKFYNGFVFPADNLSKGLVLFEHLVDTSRKYEFPVEMENALVRQRKYVAIRTQLQDDSEDIDGGRRSTSVHYLASQYLTDSSLNADVSQFDFATPAGSLSRSTLSQSGSASLTRSQSTIKKFSQASDASSSATGVSIDAATDFVDLELDDLNKHECMSSLVALLRHMHHNKITPLVEKGVLPAAQPTWMENLNKKMCSSSCAWNIKLFIAKLIVNVEQVFRPYAKFWLSPMIELVLSKEFSSSSIEPGINYFINDILVTLLSWHSVAIPESSGLVNQLVQFVTRHCHHDNRQVLRNNIEVLKALVEVWKTQIEVPTSVLFENFCDPDTKSKRNTTGIQMVGVMVANGVLPCRLEEGIDKDRTDRFYKVLAKNLTNDHKSVYAAAAEVVGMTLALMSENDKSSSAEEWIDHYVDELVKMMTDTKPDRLITCLHCIQLHYADITDRFRAKLFYWLPKLHGIYKTQCLDIICRRVDQFDDVFLDLKSKGFVDMLTQRDEATQLACLRMVHALLRHLKTEDIVLLLPALSSFTDSRSVACRAAMYDIFMWMYDNFANASEKDVPGYDDVCARSRNVLLLGLSDEDEANRLRVHNFWSHETRLPTETVDRLVAVLEAMYSPDTETQFLSYATNFMLEMTSRSPDYNREMFEEPLSECKFQDYQIESTWKQRYVAMTPLFVETQSTLATQSSFHPTLASAATSPSGSATGHVRMTMDVQNFTATLAAGADPYYNWLTQSRLNTFADNSLSSIDPSMQQSSLLFTIGRSPQQQRSRTPSTRTPVGPDFGRDRLSAGKNGSQVDGADAGQSPTDILRLRKRFIRRQDETTKTFFIKRQTQITQQRERVDRERKQKRESEVTMYRRYRIGDLPDVQIPFSAIIAPLQGLAHSDSSVARLLFNELFTSIVHKLNTDAANKSTKINACLTRMLSTSTLFYSPFIACLLDVILSNVSKLTVDANLVNAVSTASQLQSIGILLLEETILRSEDDHEPKVSKRARSERPAPPPDADKWIELARLYKSIGEYDVVNGILTTHVTTHDVTLQAIEAEMTSDYSLAIKLYNQGLSDSEKAANNMEVELWEESRLMVCSEFILTVIVLGALGDEASALFRDIGQRIAVATGEPRSFQFLMQRLSVAVQRGNAACITGTVPTALGLCYDKLCQWDKIEKVCEAMLTSSDSEPDISAFDHIWDDPRSQETLLPYLIRSKVKLVLNGSTEQQPLLKFVDQSMTSPERRSYLETYYSEQLALLYIWQDDYDRAKHYANVAKNTFFQDWSGFDELMSASRTASLQGLQRLTELQEFLQFVSNERNFSSVAPSIALAERWLNRKPDSLLDSVAVWDDIVTNRCVYLDHMAHLCCKKGLTVEQSDLPFDRYKVALRLQQVESAASQGNYTLGLRILKNTQQDATECGDELVLQWNCAFTKTHHARCQQSISLTVTDKLKALLATKKLLHDKHGSPGDVAKQQCLLANTYSLAADMALHDEAVVMATEDALAALSDIAGCKKTGASHNEIVQSIVEQGFKCIQHSVVTVDDNFTVAMDTLSPSNNASMAGDMHLALYKYCDRFLRLADEAGNTAIASCSSFRTFPRVVVKSLLKAIKFDCHEAKQLFPRLLQIVAQFPDTIDDFVKSVAEVPCWMLLSWVSQMTAVFDKPESLAIQNLLVDIAQQYPEALVYPFKLSAESYKFDLSLKSGEAAKSVKDKLNVLLSKNPLIDKFIAELEQFDQPNAMFKEWLADLDAVLRATLPNMATLRQLYTDLSCRLIGRAKRRDSESELYDSDSSSSAPEPYVPGPFWLRFRTKFAKPLDDLCGKDGQNVMKLSKGGLKEFLDKARKLSEEMNKFCAVPPNTLKEYSPWMANFQSSHYDNQLEIPGQYGGSSKPLPEYHTKISSFGETVLVMTSLRRPKRVTVRGNDEKDYKYLVKCGEDLRQDQRIEQLLELTNDIYSRHVNCRQRHLRIRTYQVIPMSPRLGVIEWMDKTAPLKDTLTEAYTDDERKRLGYKGQNPKDDHQGLMGCTPVEYYKAFQRNSRSEVVTAFRKRENLVPADLLRRVYRGLSASSEAYYRLRCEFAISHAQLCISHYIFGIGDRHLSNFMIDLQTGAMVGIDFGHAFGSATQFLPIPELVPFRLTRQLRNVLLPLGEKGLMEGVMIHCLQALRSQAELLLTTMDVFIKEPSLDWKQNAEKQKQKMQQSSTDSDVDDSWYPREKVNFARRKLHGDNCAHIMRDELRLGHGQLQYYKYIEKVLMGDRSDNVRAKLAPSGLGADQQVACLIDLATDPNILGRFWVGWEPWM